MIGSFFLQQATLHVERGKVLTINCIACYESYETLSPLLFLNGTTDVTRCKQTACVVSRRHVEVNNISCKKGVLQYKTF